MNMKEKDLNIEIIEGIKLEKVSPFRSYIARLFKGKNDDWYIKKCKKQFDEYTNQVLIEVGKKIDEVIIIIKNYEKELVNLREKGDERSKRKAFLLEYEIEELKMKIIQFYEILGFLLEKKKSYWEKCLLIYCREERIKDEINIDEIVNKIRKVNGYEFAKVKKEQI